MSSLSIPLLQCSSIISKPKSLSAHSGALSYSTRNAEQTPSHFGSRNDAFSAAPAPAFRSGSAPKSQHAEIASSFSKPPSQLRGSTTVSGVPSSSAATVGRRSTALPLPEKFSEPVGALSSESSAVLLKNYYDTKRNKVEDKYGKPINRQSPKTKVDNSVLKQSPRVDKEGNQGRVGLMRQEQSALAYDTSAVRGGETQVKFEDRKGREGTAVATMYAKPPSNFSASSQAPFATMHNYGAQSQPPPTLDSKAKVRSAPLAAGGRGIAAHAPFPAADRHPPPSVHRRRKTEL